MVKKIKEEEKEERFKSEISRIRDIVCSSSHKNIH
jgi:hypothetical protein